MDATKVTTILPDWLKNWTGISEKAPVEIPPVKTEETNMDAATQAAPATVIQISADDFKTLLKKVQTLEARVGTIPNPDPVPAGFDNLVCRKCSAKFPADHADPHKGGCQGVASQSHDFYGV